MLKDAKAKSVRFSPKASVHSGVSTASGIDSLSVDTPVAKPPPKKKSKEKVTLEDSSPADSLTTNAADAQDSVSSSDIRPYGETESQEESAAHVNFFSACERLNPEGHTPKPDKPSIHDTYSRGSYSVFKESETGCSFIDPIVNPDQKVIDYGVRKPPPLAESPPDLNELIRQLEIQHFGQELNQTNIDEMFSPRNEGELKELTERLHSYIGKMRELRNGAPTLDSNNFFKSVDAMEREMKNLKNMYEREITKLRQQLEDLGRQKNSIELQNSKLEATASDLQNRMAAELDKSQRLSDDMNTLQRAFHHKEREYQGTVQQSLDDQTTLPDVNETNRKLDQVLRENMDLHRRYDAELLLRRENEEKVHHLNEQISFNEELNRQQHQDLQDRLAAANTAILNLEGKVRVLDRPDHEKHIGEMLSSVRDAAERELYKYKQDAEEMFAKNVTMLKSQMESDRKAFEAVSDENRKLLGVIEELNTKIRNLQGETIHIEHMKRSAEENLVMERERATRHIQAMEGKLKDLQDSLFDKMKELNAARIQNLPLKAEVESLRALIDEEEKRLAMDMKLPPISYSVTRSPQASSPKRTGTPHNSRASPAHEENRASPMQENGVSSPPKPATPTQDMPGGGNFYSPDAINRTVQIEPAARFESTRPQSATNSQQQRAIGPIRPKSSQSQDQQVNPLSQYVPQASVDTGVMTNASGDTMSVDTQTMPPRPKPATITAHDYNHCTNSATGDVRIHEVSPDGRSVSLINMSSNKELDFGGYIIQQQVGGSPVAVFRFPPRIIFTPKSYITVFSGCNDTILHQPPTQFVWKEQDRWGTGPECTTLLCKPNGQAIAWTTAAHRFGVVPNGSSVTSDSPTDEELSMFIRNPNAPPAEPVFLKREKETPPSLAPQNHPHGNVYSDVHPQYNDNRVRDLGNDNSSNHRQARSQSAVPDRVPGEPYAGNAGKRMGSTTMRRYTPLNGQSGNIRKNGAIANRVPGDTTETPTPFMTPKNRHHHGVEQIRSQHHADFKPPMPRPPLFSAW